MQRTLTFRVYPTPRQAAALDEQLGLCRRLYNACLEQRRVAWQLRKRGCDVDVPREFDQNRQLRDVRAALPEYRDVPAGVLQSVPKRVQRAYQNFFRGDAAHPRFKGRARFTSLTHLAPMAPHGHGTYRFEPRHLTLNKTGRVKHRLHHFPSWYSDTCVPKTLTLKVVAGRWHAKIGFTVPDAAVQREPAPAGSIVGLDAGLHLLWTGDNGTRMENPRWLQRTLRRLRREQRSLSRRKKGSNRRRRQRLIVARIHERVADQRSDFYHQLSRRIAERYAVVAVEDNLTGLRRSRLARNVYDAAWSTLHRLLSYKLAEHGGTMVKVDPRGTSKTCSGCGEKPVLWEGRTVRCNACGLQLDRDTNAARNILKRATAVPADGGEPTPRDTGGPSTRQRVEVPVVELGTVNVGG